MRPAILILLFTCIQSLFCQERGTLPLPDKNKYLTGKTYAVVVGISDYAKQDDLKYAHRDAMAFADWLLSPAGEIQSRDDLKLLLNEKATKAELVNSLIWLIRQCKPGDRAMIYFAGHGDVETEIISEPGYLLCYDAPKNVYGSGGALDLKYLQEVITTLSEKNNAKVIVVIDACRAGKLAGDIINGKERTSENFLFAPQYANVTKILSCKSDQSSYEMDDRGDGRGIFSFYFINGLKGLADHNSNGKVSYKELERYLEDNVSGDVAPQKQEPLIKCADKNEIISRVLPEIRDSILMGNVDFLMKFSMIDSRVVSKDYLFDGDTSILANHAMFYARLKEKKFFQPNTDCAEYYFNEIISKSGSNELKDEITRNYAVALQDDAQRIINNFLETSVKEISKTRKARSDEYDPLPKYLNRAAELLGEEHYYYNQLRSNQYFYEGQVLQLEKNSSASITQTNLILEKYKKSLGYNYQNPLTLLYLSNLFATNFENLDSCAFYYDRLKTVNATWVLPNAFYGYNLSRYFDENVEAKSVLLEGFKLDSTNTFLLNSLGAVYYYQKDYSNAISIYQKSINIDSTDANAWVSLGSCQHENGNILEAERAYVKSIAFSPGQMQAYYHYGWLYYKQNEFRKAESLYLKGIENHPKNSSIRARLCKVYLAERKFNQVEKQCLEIHAFNPDDWRIPFYRACVAAMKGKKDQALTLLEESFKKDMDDYDSIVGNDYFVGLRNDKRFLKLLEDHFEE